MPWHFVQDEALEHGLFLEDELPIPRQLVQDEALSKDYYLPRTNYHCPGTSSRTILDEAFEHGVFFDDELQMPSREITPY
jgi:hypothetical protein